MDFIDDDENVKAIRETAREIGLADVLMRAFDTQDSEPKQELIQQALGLLGMKRLTGARPRARRPLSQAPGKE
jgi:hypothetical protein